MTLDVRGITVAFGDRVVLDAVSLDVGANEIVALQGPSGSGKSTLLGVIAGLIVPDAGSVWLSGRDVTSVPTHLRRIGMVFQDEQLFPHLSVGDNVGYGLKVAGVDRNARRARVGELLDMVGMSGFAGRRVHSLSGGERKRVAVARSLAPAPQLLLLDEPLTGLDRELHERLMVEVGNVLRTTSTPALWVTHDAHEAGVVADRTVQLGDERRSSNSR